MRLTEKRCAIGSVRCVGFSARAAGSDAHAGHAFEADCNVLGFDLNAHHAATGDGIQPSNREELPGIGQKCSQNPTSPRARAGMSEKTNCVVIFRLYAFLDPQGLFKVGR